MWNSHLLRRWSRKQLHSLGSWTCHATFRSLALNEELVKALACTGIKTPKAIQEKAIPAILNGSNVVIAAETGGGKTLAYLLPVLHKMMSSNSEETSTDSAPECVILTASQDLVRQIKRVSQHILSELAENQIAVVTTLTYKSKIGVNMIIVATPTSLLEATKPKDLDHVSHVIVDEADMLLTGGFEHDTKLLLASIRNRARLDSLRKNAVQFIFSGATVPDYGRRSVKGYLEHKFPSAEFVKTEDFHHVLPHVELSYHSLEDFITKSDGSRGKAKLQDTYDLLWTILCSEANNSLQHKGPQTLIFVNSVDTALALQKYLQSEKQYECASIHKKVDPFIRRQVVQELVLDVSSTSVAEAGNCECPRARAIICTDAAARGLDTLQVRHVIQFDFARDAVSFLHRIGRTGRNGGAGKVSSIVRRENELLVSKLKGAIERSETINSAFSRKRSLRKKYKRQQSTDQQND